MFSTKSLKNTVSRFASDRSGNFAMIFALTSTLMMMGAGVGLDLTHTLNIKTNLSSALDAAVLSTAREIARGKVAEADAKTKVQEFLAANLNTNRIDLAQTHLSSFKLDPATNKMTATATTSYRMYFPVFRMEPVQSLSVSSGAAYSDRKVEVSMVLDVTGSMNERPGGIAKIDELKVAAKAGVKEFIDNSSGNTRVAIVPYSTGVNSGPLKAAVVDELGNPITGSSCAHERRGSQMFTDAGPSLAKVTRANGVPCASTPLLPMTKNAATLNAVIDSLKAGGGTAGQIGLQWGWYMLSANWNGMYPAASEPVAYGTANVDKFLILMTDGNFNTQSTGLSGATVPTYPGISNLSGRLAMTYCNAIKAKKIKLFTIGFRLNDINIASEKSQALRLLKDCASTPVADETTFFNAENGAELTAAFKEIAKRVERVTLTN